MTPLPPPPVPRWTCWLAFGAGPNPTRGDYITAGHYRTYKEACDSLEQRAARYGQQGWIGIVLAYGTHPLGNRNAPGDPVTDAPGHGENTAAVCRELKHVYRVVRHRRKYRRPA